MNADNIILVPLTIYAVLAFVLYFVPIFVATVRGTQHTGAIFALNLLLGWTFIGWVGALIWAMADAVVIYADDETPAPRADGQACAWDFKRAFPPNGDNV